MAHRPQRTLAALLVAGLAWASGCAGRSEPAAVPAETFALGDAYTLVNLHPDERRRRLYSVNYLQDGLIPRCTRVTISHIGPDAMEFVVPSTGRTYRYVFHGRMYESTTDNLRLYFGQSCPEAAPGSLTPVEEQAIAEGRVVPGMSKLAVLYAAGYPPRHATPTLLGDHWRYWKSRWDTIEVVFDDGRVREVRD